MNRTAVHFDNLSTVQQFLNIFYERINIYENSLEQKLEENDRATLDLRNMKNTANEIAKLFFTEETL
jgi:regulator of replication initiation timing